MARVITGAALGALLIGLGRAAPQTLQAPRFIFEEATISQIHAALDARSVTCSQLVSGYLDRIDAYDKKGPALNAIINVNPQAQQVAEMMDRSDAGTLRRRPLHCVPIILKDNFDTSDMPTTGGSKTFARSVPPDDAFVVKRFREAGAIILAKANLTELALTGTTVSSLGGQTKNPYDLTRTCGRLERRDRGGDFGKLRGGRHRERHRTVDPIALLGDCARRIAPDARSDQPRWHHALQFDAR